MFYDIPITNYQIRQLKYYASIAGIALGVIIILGNIITALVRDSISVSESSYTFKDGFPVFNSGTAYVRFVRNHPNNLGIRIAIHKMQRGESYWDITKRHNITIDTLIAANPFLTDLIPLEGIEIVVPHEDGVLFPFHNFYEVIRMKSQLNYKDSVYGRYLPTPFKIISTDDIRLVFFKGKTPVLVNDKMARLYRIRKAFQEPIKGMYTSLYGDRVDPMWHDANFHNGVDIMSPVGSRIRPIMDGMVTYTGWRAGYGNTVIIQHHDGYSSLYGHLSSIRVKQGDWVTKEQVLGLVGSTGRSTGPHLHFTFMRHGDIVNPLLYIW